MKVVVTGAAGLLGRYVTKRLLARGDSVVAIDALSRYAMMGLATPQEWPAELRHERCMRVLDRFDSSDTFALIREEAPDAIVHAAAQTSHPRSIEEPAEDFEVNAAGTMRLLEFLRTWRTGETLVGMLAALGARKHAPAPRLVFVSSAKIYGENVAPRTRDRGDGRLCLDDDLYDTESPGHDHRAHWFDADGVTETCPIGDGTLMTPFGVSKACADLMCQQYAKLYGLDIAVLRPGCFTAAGSLATTAQNWAPLLVRAAVRGEPFDVFGYEGRQVRDLLHADDLAGAVLACVDWRMPAKRDYERWQALPSESPAKGHVSPLMEVVHWYGDVFNVAGGTGRDVSILEANDLIHEITGKRAALRFGPKREGDWPWAIFSNRKITTALGWKPTTSLRAIFEELCAEARS